ncbi:MAG: hypothetical protein AB1749_13935 [Pseudomonadota bacterium]
MSMRKHRAGQLALFVGLGVVAAFGIGGLLDGPSRGALKGLAAEPAQAAPGESGKGGDAGRRYLSAKWDPIHFEPQISRATNAQCLACHKEILSEKVREASPAGLKAADSLAWYQTLDTYSGAQATFHARHLSTPLAKEVMSLSCAFCHNGNEPREEAHGSSATTMAPGDFKLRKMVNPESSCLMCHGVFPAESMGLAGSWHELREGLETPETPNGCLTCHAEQFRTVRHQVNYLDAGKIEAMAKDSSDLCFGCHGGRAWYRISYPYPRHPWPGMDKDVPDWAKSRPTASRAEHVAGTAADGKAKRERPR